jgi:hypothetical protein
MTLKEFIEFLGEGNGHFIGFVIILIIFTEFIIRIFHEIFRTRGMK